MVNLDLNVVRGKLQAMLEEGGGKDLTQVSRAPSQMDQAAEFTSLHNEVNLKRHDQSTETSRRRALKKIDQGTYGICDECEREIGRKRLEAMDYAVSLCVACQEKSDEAEKIATGKNSSKVKVLTQNYA